VQRLRVLFASGCEECGLLFSNPLPTREELDRYYSTEGPWASSQEPSMKAFEEKYLRRLANPGFKPVARRGPRDFLFDALERYLPVHAPLPGAKVLDVGCGGGKFLDRLQGWGWRTYGIEPSTAVAFLRHHRLEAPPQDGSFDFVILHQVLEHVAEPLGLLRQIAGSLREGGVLFLIVPRLDMLPLHRDYRYCLNGRTHVVSFSETCLKGLLARAGLEMTARLDDELDAALTDGKPLRLRVVATRTGASLPLPAEPLAPAIRALRGYARTNDLVSRVRLVLPVRVRGGLLSRIAQRRIRNQRQALSKTSERQGKEADM